MDFTLGEDRLSFAAIFGDQAQTNIALKDILAALENGKLDLTAIDDSHLTIKVGDGNGTTLQTVDVQLTAAIDITIADFNDSEAEKAALLQQMLTNIAGG